MKSLTTKEEEALAIIVACDSLQIQGPRVEEEAMEGLGLRDGVIRYERCGDPPNCRDSDPNHRHYFAGPLAELALKCAAAMRSES